MSSPQDIEEQATWFALYRLEARYWYDVDYNGGRDAHEFYLSDGLFAIGPNRFEGRHGIKTFYEWRRARGKMTSRHIISNLLVDSQDERRAKAFGLITVHRGKGEAPLRYGFVPSLVADFTSDCVRGPDDVWRYASHILDPVFVGDDVPLSLAIDPRFLATPRAPESVGGGG